MKTNIRVLAVTAVGILSIISCNLPFWGSSGPPEGTVAISTKAVQGLKDDLQDSQASVETSGEIELTFTETQLNSLVASELADQSDPPIEDVQIQLRDGRVNVVGQIRQGDVYLPMNAVFELTTNNGDLGYEIISAKIGIIPLPRDVIQEFTSQFDDIFTARIKSETSNLYIDTISIQNGEMVVEGHPR